MLELALNKIGSQIVSRTFEASKLENQIILGINPGVSQEEMEQVLEGINKDIKVLEYMLSKLTTNNI